MWYRCNVKDYGASVYLAGDEASGSQQAALQQPLLLKDQHHHGVTVLPMQSRPDRGVLQSKAASRPGDHTPAMPAADGSTKDQLAGGSAVLSTASDAAVCPATPAAGNAAVLEPVAVAGEAPELGATTADASVAPALAPAPVAAAAVPADARTEVEPMTPTVCSGSSSPSASPPQPVAEVELQRPRNNHCCSTSAAGSFSDPLVHWTDFWQGPGLRCRGSSATRQGQRYVGQQPQQHRSAAQQPGGHTSGQSTAAPVSPRSPRSPKRPPGGWWVAPDHPEAPHTPRAAASHSSVPSSAGAAAPGAAAMACTSHSNQHNEITSDWVNHSCSSIVGSPHGRQPHSSVPKQQPQPPQQLLQMQQLPPPPRSLQVQQQQQQQLFHQQPTQAQVQPLSRQPSSSAGAQQPRGSSLHWWLVGGVALAAISGSAVVVAYGVMAYMMKAAVVYSFAWKAATGVAAAEGLALGGWGCSSVHKQKAAAAQCAAELVRIRSQAARELASLRGLLQQREAAHEEQVAGLSSANERLTRLTQSLRTENTNLQSALDRAAAERKSLEAAAALECSRAENSAIVNTAAAHSERVIGEVAELRAVVLDLREDLLGLVADQVGAASAASAASGQLPPAASAELLLAAAGMSAAETAAALAHEAEVQMQAVGHKKDSSGDDLLVLAAASARSADGDMPAVAEGEGEGPSAGVCRCSSGGSVCSGAGGVRLAVPRLKSVRSSVNAALAASIAETLQL